MRFSVVSATLLASATALLSGVLTVEAGNYERDMLCKLNEWRQRNGKPFFSFDNGLWVVANKHNELQVSKRQLVFRFPEEAPLLERINNQCKGENWNSAGQLMGWNYKTTDDFARTMATSGSTKDIFNGEYTHIGVVREDANGEAWWTMVMANKPGAAYADVKC
ncbi:hypothetical protein SYNPS1DRAFT_23291 [Syncephalis pseudoplumigaleata]|uniref:Uncharacterized protein n=1 Tax=Syncephalis pseudoplumigaleata TaxID=1712513 RepID=A0A4P9YZZ8_9FUNG|nr:hypothetical protein SYNPS1DRAFT_23291 [Syncephalis pseudoplumigaleata]|eukprot:RKP24640.1 hypothetical protein SYNPS1DRAFT_23291 [Syncephalis pseudoplumigaleata]